jgi:phospholipid/cholesterol/gamma-HCH transport system permease protein
VRQFILREAFLVGLAGSEHARWNKLADQFTFILNDVYGDALKNDKDFWPKRLYHRDPVCELADQGASLFVNISASPFSLKKAEFRRQMIRQEALKHGRYFFYLNQVGGNDELVFDGHSIGVDPEGREIVRQLFELGCRSMPLIAAAGFAVGVVLSMHTRASLARFGAEALIPAGLAIALVRETGPLTAALLLSGRIGAGIGAELGAMRVTEQIDALEATAVDSFKYLVVTRVIACVIALPILTTLMNFTGMLGGYAAESAVTSMPLRTYFNAAFSLIGFSDLIPATAKTMVFGFIIASVASYLGVNTTGGTEGVGRTSTKSVVTASILLILANVVLVRIIFFFYPA